MDNQSDPNNPQNPTGVASSPPQPDLTTPPPPSVDPISAPGTFTPAQTPPPAPEPPPFSPAPSTEPTPAQQGQAPLTPSEASGQAPLISSFGSTPPASPTSQPDLGTFTQTPSAPTPAPSPWTNPAPTTTPTTNTNTPPASPTTAPSTTGFNPFTSPGSLPSTSFGGFSPTPSDANPFSATPTTSPPATEPNTTDFSAQNLYAPTAPGEQPTPQPVDQAPTDLSHLIDPSAPTTAAPEATIPQPETLVTPDGGETAPSLTPEHQSKPVPKWVLGVAIGLLIAVVGASAYFILGIGQSPQQSTSLPATQQPLQAPPTPRVSATPAPATSSGAPASFGALNPSPTATPSATPKSAGELLRQGR